MSIIQSIIASSVGASAPPAQYPTIGYGYPITGVSPIDQTSTTTIAGYYEASSLTNPTVGLMRKLFNGAALTSNFQYIGDYPNNMTVIDYVPDTQVGFTGWSDLATNFTFDWYGYFKPAVSGDFYFYMDTDDYSSLFIGEHAIALGTNYSILSLDNSSGFSNKVSLIAGKYYPVRILYTEYQGGASCGVMAGLNNQQVYHNQDSAAIGQFYYDDTVVGGDYPTTGLIT